MLVPEVLDSEHHQEIYSNPPVRSLLDREVDLARESERCGTDAVKLRCKRR